MPSTYIGKLTHLGVSPRFTSRAHLSCIMGHLQGLFLHVDVFYLLQSPMACVVLNFMALDLMQLSIPQDVIVALLYLITAR